MIHRTIEFHGKTINFQDEGSSDEVLVLLHGFMNNLEVWKNFVLDYMRSIRVVAIDLIGHGESDVVEDVSSMELQAEAIKAVLDSLNVSKCVMVGHSMGGMITLAFAEKYPEYLKGFCLLHSQAMSDNPKGIENRKRACKLINDDKLKYIVDFIPNLFAKDNIAKCASEIEDLKDIAISTKKEGIVAAQLGMIERRDRQDVLSSSTVPVLFIAGSQDIRIDILNIMAQATLPKFSETMLLDCGHMSFIEEEKIIKQRLLSFTKMCFSL